MGIRTRNLSRQPLSILQSAPFGVPGRHMLLPPENTVAVAASQLYSSLAANHSGQTVNGQPVVNGMLLNGTGTYNVIDPGSVDRRVVLPIPSQVAVVPITTPAATFTCRISGYDAFGRRVVEIGTKSASYNYYTGRRIWSQIDFIEVTNYSGAAGDSLSAGYVWKSGAGTGAGPHAFPVHFDVQSPTQDVAGIIILDAGGSSGGVATGLYNVIAAGNFCPVDTTGSSAPNLVEVVDQIGGTAGKAGAVTIAVCNPGTNGPTTPVRYVVVPKDHTSILRY